MNTKTTAILALVCVAVFAYLLFVVKPFEPKPQAADKKDQKADKALLDPKPEGTNRIEVSRRDGKSFVFVRVGKDDWTLTSPIQGPASKFEVDALLDSIASMKVDKQYSKDDANRPSALVSGLDKPLATVKLLKGEQVQDEVKIGSRVPTGTGNYVQLVGDETIFVSKGDLVRHFNKRLGDYRDKRVLNFEYAHVQKVAVEGIRNFELVMATGDEWTLESPVHAQADKAKVDGMVRPLTNLRADEFVDDAPEALKLYGLDKPRLKITVETKQTIPAKASPGEPNTKPADTQPTVETKTYVLTVGGATDPSEGSYFAQVAGVPSVFTIRSDTFKSLSPSETEIRDKAIAHVEAGRVRKVEATTPGGEMTLQQGPGNKWHFADNTKADATLVGDLVKAIATMRATDYADPKKELLVLDWDHPRARIVLIQEGQVNPVTVLVGPASASGKMVYVRNPAQEGVAAVAEGAVAQLLQPPVSYRDRSVMNFNKNEIAEIQIDRTDPQSIAANRHIVLAKRGGTWGMTEPVVGPADESAVGNLVQDLASLPAVRVVAVGEKAKYGLDKPGVVVAVTMKASDAGTASASQPATMPASGPARDIAVLNQLIEFQKTNPNENANATDMLKKMLADKLATMPAEEVAALTSDKASTKAAGKVYMLQMTMKDGVVYACLPDSDVVYELNIKVYDDAIAEMYLRQVTKFEPANVIGVDFKTGAGNITLRKAGEEWKYVQDPLVKIDSNKVTDVLKAFADLKTFRFAEYNAADMEKYGVGANAERVSFTFDNGQKTEILVSAMGPAGDPTRSMRYAVLEGTKRVFLLQPDQVARFHQRIEDFQKR